MEVKGKLIEIGQVESGESKNGRWQKVIFVIETDGQYPKKIACTVWGEQVDRIKEFHAGNELTASIDIESREYNGRWYTDVKAWKIEGRKSAAKPIEDCPQPDPMDDGQDDLPF